VGSSAGIFGDEASVLNLAERALDSVSLFPVNPACPLWPALFMETPPNNRTMAEYFIRGLTEGSVTAAEVIAWADEVVVAASKTEDWMLDISTSDAEDRMGVLHHLHAVQGEIQAEVLARLLLKK